MWGRQGPGSGVAAGPVSAPGRAGPETRWVIDRPPGPDDRQGRCDAPVAVLPGCGGCPGVSLKPRACASLQPRRRRQRVPRVERGCRQSAGLVRPVGLEPTAPGLRVQEAHRADGQNRPASGSLRGFWGQCGTCSVRLIAHDHPRPPSIRPGQERATKGASGVAAKGHGPRGAARSHSGWLPFLGQVLNTRASFIQFTRAPRIGRGWLRRITSVTLHLPADPVSPDVPDTP